MRNKKARLGSVDRIYLYFDPTQTLRAPPLVTCLLFVLINARINTAAIKLDAQK